jgi:hypothetical protein
MLEWSIEAAILKPDRFTDNARVRLRLRCTCPLHQPGIADSMICQAIQPANSKSPRNTKKHPTTPTVLLSCQFLTSPSRSRQGAPPDRWQPHLLRATPRTATQPPSRRET